MTEIPTYYYHHYHFVGVSIVGSVSQMQCSTTTNSPTAIPQIQITRTQSPTMTSPPEEVGSPASSVAAAPFITLFLLAIISATAALTLHFDLSSHHISSYIPKLHYGPNEPSTLTCGSTRLEALAKNCTLDIMADAWLPPACYNSTSASLSLDPSTILSNLTGAGIFDWYRDENHTLPPPLAQISAIDELRAYTWQVYHLAHCMYSWTTTVRAMNRVREGERDVWIDQRLLSEEHVHHCAMVLAGNGGEEGVG
ncbi:hypothetical protein BDZ45DRAFT_812258 [Acephala macrosclerotiorum]|nr:hypothetical protein BDZ45DRAFT_812258 [Acephala macrosclerotiorum]